MDPVTAGLLVGGGNAVSSLVGGIIDSASNKHIADENIDFMRWANEQNLAYQRESRDLTFQREDNAIQRRVRDMRSAGINPILAAGSPAAASPVQAMKVQAPENRYESKTAEIARDIMASITMGMNLSRTQMQDKLIETQIHQEEIKGKMLEHDYNLGKDLPIPFDPKGGIIGQVRSAFGVLNKFLNVDPVVNGAKAQREAERERKDPTVDMDGIEIKKPKMK